MLVANRALFEAPKATHANKGKQLWICGWVENKIYIGLVTILFLLHRTIYYECSCPAPSTVDFDLIRKASHPPAFLGISRWILKGCWTRVFWQEFHLSGIPNATQILINASSSESSFWCEEFQNSPFQIPARLEDLDILMSYILKFGILTGNWMFGQILPIYSFQMDLRVWSYQEHFNYYAGTTANLNNKKTREEY